MSDLSEYPHIAKWLGMWVDRLHSIGDEDDYRVLCDEIKESGSFEEPRTHLRLLDHHLELVSESCANFEWCLEEERTLPTNLDQANIVVLNKLAEVRAIVGLSRLGFEDLKFIETPDLSGFRSGRPAYVEVTRLNKSFGKRSDTWDESYGDLERDGYTIGVMNQRRSEGDRPKAVDAISEAIYRKVEEKYRQLELVPGQEGARLLWISLGRDYFAAGRYELPGVDEMQRTQHYIDGIQDAIRYFESQNAYAGLSVVLSLGRNNDDVIAEVSSDH